MRTTVALLALTGSGCIFLYSEVEENVGGRGGQGGYGGGTSAQGASTQGGSGGTSGTGGAPLGCDAEKTSRVVARFPVAPEQSAGPTPITIGRTIGFVGSGPNIFRFELGESDQQLGEWTTLLGDMQVPVSGAFDDLLLVDDLLVVGHQASSYICTIANMNGCDPIVGSFLTGLVPWPGSSPFDGARFLALRKGDSRVVRDDGGGGITVTSVGPLNPAATAGFDLAINGEVIGLTTYNPAMLWLGTLAQSDLPGADLPFLTPSHLVVRNDGSAVVAVGDTVTEKLMRVSADGAEDFRADLLSPQAARSPLAYDPTCDILYAVAGLLPQQLQACVGPNCTPVGGSCGRVTGVGPVAPDDPASGSVYFVCVDNGIGTIRRWGPSLP